MSAFSAESLTEADYYPKVGQCSGNSVAVILELSVRVATEAACSPVVVVLGASADLIRKHSDLRNAQIVLNNGWTEGMASSIRIGLAVMRISKESSS